MIKLDHQLDLLQEEKKDSCFSQNIKYNCTAVVIPESYNIKEKEYLLYFLITKIIGTNIDIERNILFTSKKEINKFNLKNINISVIKTEIVDSKYDSIISALINTIKSFLNESNYLITLNDSFRFAFINNKNNFYLIFTIENIELIIKQITIDYIFFFFNDKIFKNMLKKYPFNTEDKIIIKYEQISFNVNTKDNVQHTPTKINYIIPFLVIILLLLLAFLKHINFFDKFSGGKNTYINEKNFKNIYINEKNNYKKLKKLLL